MCFCRNVWVCIPVKLISPNRLTLSNSYSFVKLQIDSFSVWAARQANLFNLHRNGYIFQNSVKLVTSANDIDIIIRTKRDIAVAFSVVKTKYMSASRDMRYIASQIATDNNTFNVISEFVYFGFTVISWCDVNLEIKQSITLTKRSFYGLNRELIE